MKKFQIPFSKTVHGYFEGSAKNKGEALRIFSEWDEIENKSNYEVFEEEIEEVEM